LAPARLARGNNLDIIIFFTTFAISWCGDEIFISSRLVARAPISTMCLLPFYNHGVTDMSTHHLAVKSLCQPYGFEGGVVKVPHGGAFKLIIMGILPFDKKEKQAIIFIGIQASGKSTFYDRLLNNGTYTHISLDILHTRNKEEQLLMECLAEGKSFVVDNTNPEISDRAKYIQKSKEYSYHIIGIFFQSIVRDCVKRNEERDNKVPSVAIASTSNKLQMPSLSEGFDELYFARIINNEFEITKWRE
jgi:predicted kinase